MLGRGFPFVILLNIVVLTLSKTDLLAPRTYCGFQHTDDYVRENDNISLDEFPWIAQLLYSHNEVKCGGALINRRYVTTAAHCIFLESKLTGVRLGEFNLMTDIDCQTHTSFGVECSDPVQDFKIDEIIQHPEYNTRTIANDIALIRLSEDVMYSEYIRPICLPMTKDLGLKDGDQLVMAAWGRAIYEGTETLMKKKISATFVPFSECRKIYEQFREPVVTVDHICAREHRENFTCEGDSGRPLMRSIKNQWEQVGIVSFGVRGTCGPRFPIVYVRIASYLDWITKNLRA